MPNIKPIKIEDALQSCLFSYCSSENPRFISLVKSEGKSILSFMLPYWENKEEYEKCSIILSKIKAYYEMD